MPRTGGNIFQISIPSLIQQQHYEPKRVLVAIFAMAQRMAPSIIWIDQPEVLDYILRTEIERRLMTELLVQLENLRERQLFVLFTTTRYVLLLSGFLYWDYFSLLRKLYHPQTDGSLFMVNLSSPQDIAPSPLLRRISRRLLVNFPDESLRRSILQLHVDFLSKAKIENMVAYTKGLVFKILIQRC